jgi:hypothetical protein
MVSWYNYSSTDPLAVNFSFSCPVPERRIGFKDTYHQMSNLSYSGGAFSADFDVVDNNNYSIKYFSAPSDPSKPSGASKLFPVAAYPGSQGHDLRGWCTITATINYDRAASGNLLLSNQAPSAVYTIPVFAEWY